MTDRALLQQALEALNHVNVQDRVQIITALRERLAQPAQQQEQEPVAWEDVLQAIARGWTHDDNKHKTMDVQLAVAIAKEVQDMVSALPQRKPLDAGEISRLWKRHTDEDGPHHNPYDDDGLGFARAIEAAHGIKENT